MTQAAGRTAGERDRFFEAPLDRADPDVQSAVTAELRRQQRQIELIASENIVSRAVLEAQGSVLTNKYAEGYPGRRYYGGCEFVDEVERLAIERAKKLFDCSASRKVVASAFSCACSGDRPKYCSCHSGSREIASTMYE